LNFPRLFSIKSKLNSRSLGKVSDFQSAILEIESFLRYNLVQIRLFNLNKKRREIQIGQLQSSYPNFSRKFHSSEVSKTEFLVMFLLLFVLLQIMPLFSCSVFMRRPLKEQSCKGVAKTNEMTE